MDSWADYLSKSIGVSRREMLSEPIPLLSILKRLTRGNPPTASFQHGRPEWTVTPADLDALDLFFNGAGGYRALFVRSIAEGEQANSAAIAFLGDWLRDSAGLLGPDFKVWIDETPSSNEALRSGNIIAREIEHPRWLAAAQARVPAKTFRGIRYKAAAGILAPRPATLIIKGEWPKGTLPRKPRDIRSWEIYEFGYM